MITRQHAATMDAALEISALDCENFQKEGISVRVALKFDFSVRCYWEIQDM